VIKTFRESQNKIKCLQFYYVLDDLNQCKLETLLLGFKQYVKTQTRNNNILDKCFRDAYVSKSMPPILNSDHNVVHMIPV